MRKKKKNKKNSNAEKGKKLLSTPEMKQSDPLVFGTQFVFWVNGMSARKMVEVLAFQFYHFAGFVEEGSDE